jgi:hypothetical protein
MKNMKTKKLFRQIKKRPASEKHGEWLFTVNRQMGALPNHSTHISNQMHF